MLLITPRQRLCQNFVVTNLFVRSLQETNKFVITKRVVGAILRLSTRSLPWWDSHSCFQFTPRFVFWGPENYRPLRAIPSFKKRGVSRHQTRGGSAHQPLRRAL